MLIMVCKKCGSTAIDVNGWVGNSAEFKCYSCGYAEPVRGFTGGRLDSAKHKDIHDALSDVAMLGGIDSKFAKKLSNEICRMVLNGSVNDATKEAMEEAEKRFNMGVHIVK